MPSSTSTSTPTTPHDPSPSAPTSRPTPRSVSSSSSPTIGPPPTLRRKPSAGILTTTTSSSGTRTTRLTATSTSNSAPATPALATDHRFPLQKRDHNVPSTRRIIKPPPGLRLSTLRANMAYEKPSSASTARSPAMPTVARAVNKPPLTPKVAVAPRAPTLQTPNPPVTTPLPRRTPRADLNPGANGAYGRDKDEMVSPVSAFLANNNITPRSGSRQVRVDSAGSTPTGTPTLERHDSWESRAGLGIPAYGADDLPRRPTVSFGSSVEMGSSRQDADSKFFYASEAQKPVQQPVPVKPIVAQPRAATFFYANGETVPPKGIPSQAPLTPTLAVSAPGLDGLETKFVYANGPPNPTPLARTSTAPLPIARTNTLPLTNQAPVVPITSRIPTSRPGTAGSYTSPRPSSPVKLAQHPPPKLMRSPIVTTNPQGPRGGRPGGHVRSSSMASNLTMAEPPAVARLMSAHGSASSAEASPSIGAPSPTFAAFSGASATAGFASLLQAAEDFAEDEEDAEPESQNSPTKSPSQEKDLTDLVHSARRERKVQDLEITNASLEAINRTLERQLRKQTAEIRRFKRLSRSGRLSVAPAGSRVVSSSSVEGGALARAGMGLDDLSEEESEMDAQDEEMESEEEEEDLSDSEVSGENPATTALRDAKHRQKDEQRLQLDLSKHQQLLVDSQKINQSLKRCLGWTEDLIKEGKRALAYQVRVSEVELAGRVSGGRVLAPEVIEARERREAREARLLAGEDVGDMSCDDRSALGTNFLDDLSCDDRSAIGTNYLDDMSCDDRSAIGTNYLDDMSCDDQSAVGGNYADLEGSVLDDDDTGSELWGKDGQDRDSGIELPRDGG
ncbi:hypothetical protein QBC39DRAFT_27774 [Podospora conica]|nr:hypothetical protein QBC39DRAFT_27774 [Schizothecium conicum]